ncbi:hypothetical protein GCM10027059_38650 [Myceligenerans halotolerans]
MDLKTIDAVVLDTDGVITDTARVHAAAWKRAFDELLRERGEPPFDAESDYLRYVDGRPRADGARGFLGSRGIVLPEEALESLLDRKTRYFLDDVAAHGVRAFPDAVAFLQELRRRRVGVAAVSASRNCGPVLRAAGVDALADVRVDGVDAARLDLPGKPDPALFLEAARRLAAGPGRCAVVEDALAGVEAGRRGGFGTVIGVDRAGGIRDEMRERGAHLVVGDLAELTLTGRQDGRRHTVV